MKLERLRDLLEEFLDGYTATMTDRQVTACELVLELVGDVINEDTDDGDDGDAVYEQMLDEGSED